MSADSLIDHAAAYALGVLDTGDKSVCETELTSGTDATLRNAVDSFEAVTGLLGTAVTPVAPPPSLRARLFERIATPPAEKAPPAPVKAKKPATPLPAGLAALSRANDMPWVATPFAGIRSKRLFTNSSDGTTVWLVNMAPGSFYPPHHHTAIEHTFVIEGDIVFDGYALQAGEYQAALPDSDHDKPITTRGGCTVLIINNAHDQVFAAATRQ